jgi:outer membrane cobalamin receptor
MNKFYHLIFFLFCISFSLQAQTPTGMIHGSVRDHAGQALTGAIVVTEGGKYSASTDEHGVFRIAEVTPGNYVLSISYVGFKTIRKTVVVKKSADVKADFKLISDQIDLNEVVVAGKTEISEVRTQAFNVTAIDGKKLYNTSADLNQVLNRTTGVRVRESGGMGSGFNFSLNGFSGNQVKFFLDGVPMTNFGSSLSLNNIPINMAERIEVYKGVVPVDLGADALGGAVNIVTNQKIKRYVDASYSIGSFNTHRVSFNTRYTSQNGFTVNANAFVNYSDNNYKVDVRVADPVSGVFAPEKKYPHFHDGYKSATLMVEAGVTNKKFADRLLFGVIVSGNEKEIQQGSNMQRVVGQAYTRSKAFIPTLKYKKEDLIIKGLSLALTASYNISESRSVDTSSRVYDWTGNYTFRRYGNNTKQGELGEKTIYIYNEKDFLTTTNLKYNISPNHSITFNHTYSDYNRKEKDEYKPKRLGLNSPAIRKQVMGLGYKMMALDNRLSATVFGKIFRLATDMVIGDTVNISTNQTQTGYGVAGTYYILPVLQVKASYENAYRLPESGELLGDGLNVKSNPKLNPEQSYNLNAGVAFSKRVGIHTLGMEGGFISRRATDFIRSRPEGAQSIYENMRSVKVTGFEGLIRYGYKDFLNFEVNGTYQNIINTNKFDPPGSNLISYVYKLRVPNIPFLFANADLNLRFKKIKFDDDNLTVNVGCNFVEAFYLYWPTLGDPQYKRDIPRQITENVGVAYSLKNGRYNIALDCRNITNVKVYDYFNVQKPGRSFSAKLRYFFN